MRRFVIKHQKYRRKQADNPYILYLLHNDTSAPPKSVQNISLVFENEFIIPPSVLAMYLSIEGEANYLEDGVQE